MEKELEKLVNDKILKWLPWVGENYDQNKHSKISYKKFSENQIARQFDLFYNDNKMQINSIKHCSTHYSIDKWQGYLKEQKIFDFI
jgi:hypothetical protein